MVSLRYHIVSIVSVFLALALGIIVGTTTIDQSVVARLEAQKAAADARQADLQLENETLLRSLEVWNSLGEARLVPEIRGALAGRQIVLVVTAAASSDLIEQVSKSLAEAGAAAAGRVRFTDKWRLDDRESRDELAIALGIQTSDPAELLAASATRLGGRLGAPGDARDEDDLLFKLQRAGFLDLDDLPAGNFPPSGHAIAMVGGGGQGQFPSPSDFIVPFLGAVPAGTAVVVSEPLAARDTLVEPVRRDGPLRRRIATVDHVDTLPGRYALVLAMRDVTGGRPAGHYGIRGRTDGIAPAAAPPTS